ncbi:MAG: N-acetylmuramoyl-L-alanine amidase [Candidatus Kurthia intestinigallinarum]
MSNSSLVNYTKLSPNYSSRNGHKISKITIHHMAGNLSVESCGAGFASSSRQASSNYGVGSDGRVGLYVDEAYRSWASANRANDEVAVTIEVANDVSGGNWHVSDVALEKTIELCVDICKRNGIKKLNFTGDQNGNLTMHKYFYATACPGPYLESKFTYIAEEVNKRLNEQEDEDMAPRFKTINDIPSYMRDETQALIDSGALKGTGDGGLNVTEDMLRCMIINKRYMDKLLSGEGTPASSWARQELDEAVKAGVTDGSRPRGYATREEAAIMVKRAINGK